MAYMDKAHADRIRTRLKEALPAKDGWRFKCSISSGHLGIDVTLMQGPVKLEAYDYDPFTRDATSPNSAESAKAMGRVKEVTEGDINHFHYESHYTPETVEVLRKVVGATMAEHWDDSDIMSDYFSCAFYPHFRIGEWRKPYKVTGR